MLLFNTKWIAPFGYVLMVTMAYGQDLTSAALWKQYAAAPNSCPNIPNCSYAGYHYGESALPTAKVVANVRQAGAVGDGKADDTAAFAKAIDQALAAGGGAVLVPQGTYRINGMIHLKHDGVVLRGEGRGKTVLDFSKSLSDLVGAENASGKSAWSWSGGLLWIAPGDTFDSDGKLIKTADKSGQAGWEFWRSGDVLAEVSGSAAPGETVITVESSDQLKPGQLVLMTWDNPADYSLVKHIAGHPTMDAYNWESATGITPPAYGRFKWPVEIVAVKGNQITLKQPLRIDVKPEWKVRFEAIGSILSESGVEHLTIRCHAPMTHKHLSNQGHNAIYINRAVNCFVRDVEIRSAENGINIASSKNVTVTEITFTGPEQHHHTFACRASSHDCIFEKFELAGPLKVQHGINTECFSSGNVWRAAKMPKGTFDSHRGLSFDSIRTDITLANDATGPGGAGDAGPFLGKRMVHWNIRIDHSPRKVPGEFVFQPEAFPMGALVGVQGAPIDNAPAWAMPKGDKGCVVVDPGKEPAIKDLYVAELQLRLGKGR